MSSLLPKKRNGRKKRFSEIWAFTGLYVSATDQAMILSQRPFARNSCSENAIFALSFVKPFQLLVNSFTTLYSQPFV